MPIVNGVPYYSQWDDDGGSNVSDCGPACVKMLLGWNEKVNKGVSVPPIDTVSIAAGLRRPGDNTHLIQLKRAAADYGLTLDIITDATIDRVKREIDAGRPVLSLIHYGALTERLDQGFTGGHYVVVVGYTHDRILLNDPDWWGARRNDGERFYVPQSEFETAISNTYANSPFQALVVIEGKSIEFPEFSDPRWREVTMNVTRNYTNVRRLPTTNSASIGTIYRGTAAKVLVEETVKRFDGSWLPIRVDLGYSTPGWVRSDVVNYKPVVDEPTATISWHRATVSSRGNRTNVREVPSVQNARVGQVFRNTPAEIAPEAGVQRPDGLWLPIHIGDNFEIEGWVRDDVVNYHLV